MVGRLQKVLSAHGVASRREAERMIADGRVTVNGVIATVGMSVNTDSDLIMLDGEVISDRPASVYVMLNKPRGVITAARDDRGRRTVVDVVDCGVRVYPVGRLDLNSEGLLIMTNDGRLAEALMHPRSGVFKTYRVTVAPYDTKKITALGELEELEGESISPPHVELVDREEGRCRLDVSISEGKNRQIRRMCETCGFSVLRLKRTKYGPLTLSGLRPGQWRVLEKHEIAALKAAGGVL